MSEPDVVILDYEPSPPAEHRVGLSHAEWMLILATAVWGMSFALAKGAGEALNRAAGLGDAAGSGGGAFGPVAVLALRFTLAALAWAILVPASRAGWTRLGFGRAAILGALLALGLILQHIALDTVSEAVAAFLTSLTVIFVPLILWLAFRKKLVASAWLGVAIALPGVWLMSGATRGFSLGVGEWLGLACAVAFAWHLPLINRYADRGETPWRMALGQFAIVALACWIGTLFLSRGVERFDWSVLATRDVWLNVGLLVAGPTLLSFGLANYYQPRVDPVRAVLMYLIEPVFSATFAWLWVGRTMTQGMIAGGALILVANAVVELWPVVRRRWAANGLPPLPLREGPGEG